MNTLLSSQAAEAHVLKDGYNELTTKGCVRLQRAKPKKGKGKKDPITPVPVIIESLQQKLPTQMDRFWLVVFNKLQFEHCFVNWTKSNYDGAKAVYFWC